MTTSLIRATTRPKRPRDEGEVGDAVLLHPVQHFEEVEFAHEVERDALHGLRHAVDDLPVGVVHWEQSNASCALAPFRVVGLERGDVDDLPAVGDVVQMCDLDTFRDTRCSR